MNSKLTVLLTNDDGYSSEGIRYLYDILSQYYEVIVVAPQHEQSGVGHAFTFNQPLHYEKIPENSGMQGFFVSGTPSDCVKFAISYLMKNKPDIIVSGLNIGENSGLSAFYSGTVAAAREGAFWNISSFAFSICAGAIKYAADYVKFVPKLIEDILSTRMSMSSEDKRIYYNINFPCCKIEEVQGTRITCQSLAYFDDRYEKIEVQTHKTGEGFMIYGEKKDIETSNGFDSRALMNNHITITPLFFDATAYNAIASLRWLEENYTKR